MLLALDIVGGFESRSVSPKKRKFLAGAALGLRLVRFKLELVSLCPFTDTCSCVARERVSKKEREREWGSSLDSPAPWVGFWPDDRVT